MGFLASLRDRASELRHSRFARQSTWMTAGTLLSSFLWGVLFWRIAGPALLGMLKVIQTSVEFVGNLDLLLDEAMTRSVIRYRESGEKAKGLSIILLCYAVDLVVGLLVFALVWIWVAPFAPEWYARLVGESGIPPGEVSELIRIFALSLLIGTLNSSGIGILQAFEEFQRMSLMFVLDAVLKLVLPLSAWGMGFGLKGVVWAFVLQTFVFNATLGVMVVRLIRREYAGISPARLPRAEVTAFGRFVFVNTLSRIPKEMFRDLDTLILGRCASVIQVGHYTGAKQFASKLGFMAGSVGSVLYPKLIAHAHARDWSRFRKDIRKITGWMVAASLPLAAVMMLAAPYFLLLVKETDPSPILPAMGWILAASFLTNVTCFVRPGIMALGRPGISVVTNAAMLGLLFLVGGWLVARSGHVGMAQAWFLTHLVGVGLGVLLLRRELARQEAGIIPVSHARADEG